jgi:hypothetical protein
VIATITSLSSFFHMALHYKFFWGGVIVSLDIISIFTKHALDFKDIQLDISWA